MSKKCCKGPKKEDFNKESKHCANHTQEKADAGKCCQAKKKDVKKDAPKKGCGC